MWDPSGWDHNAVCTGQREILVIEAEQFWRQTKHGGTGKAHRRRKIERSKQERAGRPGLGGSEQLTEIYTKKTTAIRDTSQSQKTEQKTEWVRKHQAGKNGELRQGSRRKGRAVWYSAVIGSIVSWVEDGQGREEKSAGLVTAILLPSGFYFWGIILSGAEEFPCSPTLKSVLLFPEESGCRLPCALLVIPTDSMKGSAFTRMCRSNKVW